MSACWDVVLACISRPQQKQCDEQRNNRGQSAHDGTSVIPHHVQPRIERLIRQTINGRSINKQIERMHLGIGLTRGVAIEVRLRYAAPVELFYTLASVLANLVDRTEVDGLRRTRLGTRWFKTVALPVVAQCAFVRMASHVAARDDAERASRYAAGATVADVCLNINILEFVMNDRTGRAGLIAWSGKAMLAVVAHHQPAIEN